MQPPSRHDHQTTDKHYWGSLHSACSECTGCHSFHLKLKTHQRRRRSPDEEMVHVLYSHQLISISEVVKMEVVSKLQGCCFFFSGDCVSVTPCNTWILHRHLWSVFIKTSAKIMFKKLKMQLVFPSGKLQTVPLKCLLPSTEPYNPGSVTAFQNKTRPKC